VLYTIDEAGGTARIGDLSDEPIAIPLDVLTAARGRIKKDKHRAMWMRAGQLPSLKTLVHDGLVACRDGLLGANAVGGSKTNFTLEALRVWGTRLHGSREKESWERMFAPGARLWRGLTSINEYIEHYGTGGGLSRPLFAEFLEEAGQALGSRSLRALGEQYVDLGRAWSALADAALPDDVAAMREAKELLARFRRRPGDRSEENAILNADRMEIAGAHPDEGEGGRRLGIFVNGHRVTVPVGAPQADA